MGNLQSESLQGNLWGNRESVKGIYGVYVVVFVGVRQILGRIIESWSGLVREMFPTADNTRLAYCCCECGL